MIFEFGDFEFEWDEYKAAVNVEKHGITFEEAATVFRDYLMQTLADDDHSGEEDRYISLGMSMQGRLMKIVYTERIRNIRIISAREPTPKERRDYENPDK